MSKQVVNKVTTAHERPKIRLRIRKSDGVTLSRSVRLSSSEQNGRNEAGGLAGENSFLNSCDAIDYSSKWQRVDVGATRSSPGGCGVCSMQTNEATGHMNLPLAKHKILVNSLFNDAITSYTTNSV